MEGLFQNSTIPVTPRLQTQRPSESETFNNSNLTLYQRPEFLFPASVNLCRPLLEARYPGNNFESARLNALYQCNCDEFVVSRAPAACVNRSDWNYVQGFNN